MEIVMSNFNVTKHNYKLITIYILLTLVVFLPAAIYMFQFYNELSTDHKVWAEFGSFIGGIYSVIFSLFLLIVLIKQTNAQINMNKYIIDQTYIQRSEKDLEYYIEQLDKCLSFEISANTTYYSYLNEFYASISDYNLSKDETQKQILRLFRMNPKIFNIWASVYPILIGLNEVKERLYILSFNSSRQKILSVLSVGTCIALDNIYLCHSADAMKGKYFFKNKVL